MNRNQKQRLAAAVASVGLGLVMQGYAQAAVTFVPTSDNLWSNDANWGGTPVSGQDVIFDNTSAAGTAGTVTSVVDTDQTINSLLYSNSGTTSFQTTQINAGVTLTVSGNNAVRVGMMTPASGAVVTQAAITGGGTLTIAAPSGTFAVTNENLTSTGTSKALLDLHGLANFNATVTNFLVGTKVDGTLATGARTTGDLILADTNTITASTAIIGWNNTNNRTSSLTLGRVNNFNVDTFYVAREKTGPVTMQFGSGLTDATMTLRGKAGGNTRTNFSINDFSAQSTSTSNPGNNIVDFRGGTLDAMIETLTVAVGQTTTGTGPAQGTVFFSKGNLDVNTVLLGKTTSTTAGAGPATGTLNISGGTTRATNITLGSQASAATATGILNVTGGLVNVTGAITDGGGASTLFIDNGTVDMKPAGDTSAGNVGTTTNRIDNFRINGILANAGSISVSTISGTGTISNFSGTFTLNSAANVAIGAKMSGAASSILSMNGGGTMSFANGASLTGIGGFSVLGNSKIDMTNLGGVFNAGQGIISGGSGTLVGSVNLQAPGGTVTVGNGVGSAGTLSITGDFNANSNAKFVVDLSDNPAVASDLINVGGNFTLSGGNIDVTPLGALTTGSKIRLLNYAGTKTGSFGNPVVTSNSRYTFAVDESTDKQVNLIVGGSNANLVWAGGGGNLWDVVTSANWNANAEKFFQSDAVTFDDTSDNNTVTVSVPVFPASVVVNSGTNYTFTGGGRIGGSSSITKSGTGTLLMNLTGGNDFSGAVNINGGMFTAGSTTALGNTVGGTFIAAGATLNVNAQNLGAEAVSVAGTGADGLGAIVNNSATGQNNALRFVTMTGDTLVGGVGRWDIRGNPTATLDMGGFNLSKTGAAQFSLVDVAVSNPGNINVNQGTLSIESKTALGGSAANKLNVNGSTLQIFGLVNAPAWSLNLTDSTMRINSGTNNAWAGPVTISGANTIDVTATTIAHAFNGVISGTGSINKTSVGPLTLNAANTYTGTTTITAGTIKLGAGGSIATTPLIDVKGGAFLDVSAVTGGYVLGGAQTLQGSGTIVGNFSDSAGARIAPGGPAVVGTLSFSNSASFTGGGTLSFNLTDSGATGGTSNDLIKVGGNLSLAGLTTIEVNPLAPLTSSYVIMTYGGTKTGTAADNLSVLSASRYTFALDDSQPNQILLNVTGGAVATLDWVGGNTTLNWDVVNPDKTGGTPNWNNTASATPDRFFQADTVHFGDSTNNTVTLVGALSPATINIDGPNTDYTFVGAGKLSGGTLNLSSGRKLTIANTGINDSTAPINVFNGSTLQVGTGGTAGNLGSGNISNDATVVFNRSDTVTLANLLSGGGTYEQRGPGLLIVSNAGNNFNGNMAVTGGTLKPTVAAALGNAGVVVSNGGTLDVNGLTFVNRAFTVSGAGVGGLGAVVNTGASQQNAFLNLTLAGDTTLGGDVRFDLRSNTNGTAVLNTNGQPVKLTKVGLSQFSMVGAIVDGGLGDIDVQAGTFSVELGTTSLGAVDNTLSLASGATLQFWATTNTLSKKIALNGGTIHVGSGTSATNNVFSGPISVNAPSFIDTNGGNFIFTGALSGTNTLTKTGGSGNTLTLNGDGSAYTGDIISNAGTITVASNGALGSDTKSVTLNNTTATFGGTGTRLNLAGDITIDKVPLTMTSTLSGVNEQRTSLTSTGANTWNGPITVNGVSSTGLSCDNGTFTVNGNISGPHVGNFFLRGGAGTGILNGTFNVPGANLFKTDNNTWTINSTGNTAASMGIAVGTLNTGIANALPPTAILTMGQTSDSASPTLELNGFDQTVGGLAVLAVGGTKKITNSSGTLATLTVNVAATNATSFGKFGLITGNLGLTKTGAGSQALASAQSYTGPTTVSGGTLSVSGSIASSSGVTVNNAAGTFDAAASQTVQALTVTAGQARVVNAIKSVLTVGDGTLPTSQLSLTGGKLDLMTNGLAVHYAVGADNDAAALASVRSQIIAGYHASAPGAGDGDWKGTTGITSSSIGSLNAVGYALAGDVLPFDNGATTDTFLGTTVDKNTVVARYTLTGDVNLDGTVDFLDLAKLAQSYNVTDGTRQWSTGDVNYDGNTDFLDLAKMAQNYNTALGAAAVPGASADFNADLARAFAAVPEPGALGLIAIGGITLLGKRRRRSRR